MTERLSSSDFNIGDIVRCNNGADFPIFGQVVDVHDRENEIEIYQTRCDRGLLTFQDWTMKQPIECVEMLMNVDCDFDQDSHETQVRALVGAWKHFGIVLLDEDTLCVNGITLADSMDLPIIAPAHERIVRDIWGTDLGAFFSEMCCSEHAEHAEDADEENEYDFSDPFIDNSDDTTFTRARDTSDPFVRHMHESVRFMSHAPSADETKRQQSVRAFLNHLHMAAAHGDGVDAP